MALPLIEERQLDPRLLGLGVFGQDPLELGLRGGELLLQDLGQRQRVALAGIPLAQLPQLSEVCLGLGIALAKIQRLAVPQPSPISSGPFLGPGLVELSTTQAAIP